LLSESEVKELREGLKRKWDEINKEYQMITHLRLIDTTGLKRRKETYEKQLKEIEEDIRKLNKAYIFVE
jgi:predicted GTPase